MTHRQESHNSPTAEILVVHLLTDQQTADLNRLKEWLYRRRITARQEAMRIERQEQKKEEQAKTKVEQPALFEF